MEKVKGAVTKGITLKLVSILVPLTVIFVSLMVLGIYTVFKLRGDAIVVNYAGQMRYRSYKLALQVNEYPALQGGARDSAHRAILSNMEDFETILYGLRDGNKTLGLKGFRAPRYGGRGRKGEPFNYTDPWWQYDRHIKDYNERTKPLILHVLDFTNREEAVAALKLYNKNVHDLVTDLDRTVNLLSQLTEKKIRRFKDAEFILLGLFLGVIGVSAFLAAYSIRRPLIDLLRGIYAFGHGDMDHRVPVRGSDEMATLAQGFNSMAELIKKDMETIRAQIKEISASRRFLNDVLGNIGFYVRVVNPRTHKVFLQNKPLQTLFPRGLERPCYTLWGRETECDLCVSMKAVEENRYHSKEEETPEGIIYEVHAFPFAEPDGTVTNAIEVIRDITARRKTERDLEDSRMQLMQSQKMAAIGHLSSGIAHSINNPLSGVNMYVDVLLKKIEEVKDCAAYPDLKNHLTEVKEAAKRCNTVVKDLLSIARLPKPEKQPVYLNETIEHVLSVVVPQIKLMKIQLVREFSPTAPRVLGSHSQLETVFMNIISNAIDAMAGGGTLTVRTEHLAREGKVEVAIQDTGCGINKKDLPYIFNPYFTTKPVGRGTGLGLSISQLTIQSHRGSIEVDSEVGRGTTFRIKLPVYRESLPLGR
ncbi:MAG: ATP-binding protein [Candidatus Brocadiaceae bacterium]|nr:ATP-binding protein [Candidatus Brocadiaceae bacterium]